jgi:hypothetical protein
MAWNTIQVTELKISVVADIIRRPVFYLKHDVSKTGFCFLSPTDRDRIQSPKRRFLNET